MVNSLSMQIYTINKWVYQYYSRKEPVVPEKKVAWISSFVPVELLEALDFAYVYPESYAAVISASGKEQECLKAAQASGLSLDCCCYSACFNGSLLLKKGPRGMPPHPDILIASSNQCNTLPNWWNLMAAQLHIPLVILDYPGERNAGEETAAYVENQHRNLVRQLEAISGKTLDQELLATTITVSRDNVLLWKEIVALLPNYDIPVGLLFDYISPLILARCQPMVTEFFNLLKSDIQENYPKELGEGQQKYLRKRIYWAGYPFWYHPERCINTDGCRIVGANYITWWNLNYSGNTIWDMLYNAYNFTVLNLSKNTRVNLILDDIRSVNAQGVVINHNKSCKRDFTSLQEKDCPLPFAAIESDMIDRTFLDMASAKERIEILLSMI
jgi:benzoyl-CoA reductase/2-hydroxyglutaryl-CoA dehydratase subunit BcrC/BadD/HgdB